jgi:thiol-disulfide isomerase/thioredoxin
MKVTFLTACLVIGSSITISATPAKNVEQISSKFRKNMRAIAADYSRSLVQYLKNNPSAEDFLDGLKALEQIDLSEQEIVEMRDVLRQRSAKVEAQLAGSNDPAQMLSRIDELLKLGAYLDMEDAAKLRLLEKKYTLVIKLPDEKKRVEKAFGEEGVVGALLFIHQEKRQKREGIAFLKRVKEDFPTLDAQAFSKIEKAFSELDSIGEPFALRFKSLKGEEVDIANYKGSVVLIDFWATWCGPCMRDLPQTVALYDKFHGGGLEIIGVSLDQERDTLERVLRIKKIPWPQFFDGKGWQNEIASAHGISSLPATFLMDQNSILTAINLRGSELENKITELLLRKPHP